MTIVYRLYAGLQSAWLVLGVIAAVAVYGLPQAALPAVELPEARVPAAAGIVGVAIVGFLVLGRLRIGRWYAVGRQVGLTPDGSAGLRSRLTMSAGGLPVTADPLPDLAGTVDGRPVRVTTYYVPGREDESGTNYTVVKASIDDPIADGFLLGGGGDGPGFAGFESAPPSMEPAAVDDEFVVLGDGAGERAEEILTERVRDALRSTDAGLVVGDPTDVLMAGGGSAAAMLPLVDEDSVREKLRSNPANDASSIAVSQEGLTVDATELQRQAAAVAAVADAVDRSGGAGH